MDEAGELSDEAPAGDVERLVPPIRRDTICVAVALLAERRNVSGSTAYQILVEGAESVQLSVRETARLVVISPSAVDDVAVAS
jgi:hypothetical protein